MFGNELRQLTNSLATPGIELADPFWQAARSHLSNPIRRGCIGSLIVLPQPNHDLRCGIPREAMYKSLVRDS
jgi:hypothetical protein